MAVDSRDKRFSLIGFAAPIPDMLPNPDGAIGTQDRAMLLWLYAGLALDSPAVAAGVTDCVVDDIAIYSVVLADTAYGTVALKTRPAGGVLIRDVGAV